VNVEAHYGIGEMAHHHFSITTGRHPKGRNYGDAFLRFNQGTTVQLSDQHAQEAEGPLSLANDDGLRPERTDYAVWPLAERLAILFGGSVSESTDQDRQTAAVLQPIFATAISDPTALTVLASLRQRDFRTAIVSNTPWGTPPRSWRAELACHKLLAAVDANVFCTDVGFRKPHSAPFELALSLLDVSAVDAVFVGDDPR